MKCKRCRRAEALRLASRYSLWSAVGAGSAPSPAPASHAAAEATGRKTKPKKSDVSGRDVVVFEAEDRVGGRIQTIKRGDLTFAQLVERRLKTVRDHMALECVGDWDAVILGSAIYAAYWQKDARRFTERFHEDLKARPLWLFSSGPLDRNLGRSDQPITPHGAEITAGLGARSHRTFGGRLSPSAAVDAQVLGQVPVDGTGAGHVVVGGTSGVVEARGCEQTSGAVAMVMQRER